VPRLLAYAAEVLTQPAQQRVEAAQLLLPHVLGWPTTLLSLGSHRRRATPFRPGPSRRCGRRIGHSRTSVSVRVPSPCVCSLADIRPGRAVSAGTQHPRHGVRNRTPCRRRTARKLLPGLRRSGPGTCVACAHGRSHTHMNASCAAGHRRSMNMRRHLRAARPLAAPRAPLVSGSAMAQHRGANRGMGRP
jgi:hypothetical protein